jgi:hypothetical protein
MRRDEAEKLAVAIDGVLANLETMRLVLSQMVDDSPPVSRTEPFMAINDPDANICSHEQLRQIETMGGIKSYCFDCGYEE